MANNNALLTAIQGDIKTASDLNILLSFVDSALIRPVITSLGITPTAPLFNAHLMADVIIHFKEDMKKYKSPNEYKVGGYMCFWIKKLKPFRMQKKLGIFTNEALALQIGLNIVANAKGSASRILPKDVYMNLGYDLRYRTVTPSVIANQFHLLYV